MQKSRSDDFDLDFILDKEGLRFEMTKAAGKLALPSAKEGLVGIRGPHHLFGVASLGC